MLSKENILELKTRRKIYHFICVNPGLHVREISRRLSIPKTTLVHHVRYLKRQDIIKERVDGGIKQIFASEEMGVREKQILSLLRQKIPCRIFLYLIFSIACSQIELSKELEIHPTTVTYHIKKMINMGIIEEAPVHDGCVYPYKGPKKLERKPKGREIFYRRKSQEIIDLTYKILITHKHSLSDEAFIDAYINYLNECDYPYPKNKKLKTVDSMFKNAIDSFSDFFRPPFCA